jgi:hypothetical protein
MRTYVVYDKQSGAIIHTHRTTAEGPEKPEEILRLVPRARQRSELEVMEVEPNELRTGETYSVDAKTKKLTAAGSAGVHSAAGALQIKAPRSGNQ